MTCPSCGGELVEGADRCPVCDGAATPRVEGALAADPRLLTPPARPKARPEPIREIPALRRQSKERSWRDEVQERVRSRRQKRVESGLPLFDGIEGQGEAPPDAPPVAPTEAVAPAAVPVAVVPAAARVPTAADAVSAPRELGESVDPFPEKRWELERRVEERAAPLPGPPVVDAPPSRGRRPAARDLELDDLPLASPEVVEPAGEATELDALDRAVSPRRRPMPSLEVDTLGDGAVDPEVELSAPVPDAVPVERPARPFERVQAAAVDLALFSLLAMVVVYFAGRAARVEMAALAGAWRWLAAYLGLLAAFYASYFTGTTGQTPGKLVTGLRVVGSTGRPPAYLKAAARAVVGLVGVVAAGLGCLPMAFDPAARALHDRLFHTRVVRS